MNKKTIYLCLLLIVLCVGAFQPLGCNTSITGIVTNPDGEPVSGADVVMIGGNVFNVYITTTTSAADGSFLFENVPYGECFLGSMCEGYNFNFIELDSSYFSNGIGCKDIVSDLQLEYFYWFELSTGSASGGGISDDSGRSEKSSLAINTLGNPVIAWSNEDDEGIQDIYLKQWNGTSWEELDGSASEGGISDTAGDAWYPALAINNSGNPLIAWGDDTPGEQELYVKQWNGTAWEEIGTGSASGGGISDNAGDSYVPSIAFNASGNPIIAWCDTTSSYYEIYVKQWNGSSWVEFSSGSASGGGISISTGTSCMPSLVMNDLDNPVIAWHEDTGEDNEIYLKQWNGSSWEELGGSASGGGISDNTGDSYYPSLAINGAGNPVVAWGDFTSGNSEIYIKQWNGSSWEEVGTGSASDAGISDGVERAEDPVLVIKDNDNYLVAWEQDFYISEQQIFIKQWNGIIWEEMGEGSASGYGISRSIYASVDPAMALDDSDNPVVAWSDYSSGNGEIYIIQYDPDE